MIVAIAILLFIVTTRPSTAIPRLGRLAIVGFFIAAITSYFWLPFILLKLYLNASTNLQSWKYDSYGAQSIINSFLSGDLLDHRRLPVLTFLMVLGVGAV